MEHNTVMLNPLPDLLEDGPRLDTESEDEDQDEDEIRIPVMLLTRSQVRRIFRQ